MVSDPYRSDGSVDPGRSLSLSAMERALVERIRAGDAVAFEELFRTYFAPLASFAHAHVDARDVAEEIVQELFLSIWSKRADWHVTIHLKSYLYTAVHNRVRSFHRGRRVEGATDAVLAADAGGGERLAHEQTDDMVRRHEVTEAIRIAIAALPERTREVFLLNRDGELTYREIAVRLGIRVKTVEFHMGRALVSLRERLAEWR